MTSWASAEKVARNSIKVQSRPLQPPRPLSAFPSIYICNVAISTYFIRSHACKKILTSLCNTIIFRVIFTHVLVTVSRSGVVIVFFFFFFFYGCIFLSRIRCWINVNWKFMYFNYNVWEVSWKKEQNSNHEKEKINSEFVTSAMQEQDSICVQAFFLFLFYIHI